MLLYFVLPIFLMALLIFPSFPSLPSFLTTLALTLQSHCPHLFPSFSKRRNYLVSESLHSWSLIPLGRLSWPSDPKYTLILHLPLLFPLITLTCYCFYLSLSLLIHCLCPPPECRLCEDRHCVSTTHICMPRC